MFHIEKRWKAKEEVSLTDETVFLARWLSMEDRSRFPQMINSVSLSVSTSPSPLEPAILYEHMIAKASHSRSP